MFKRYAKHSDFCELASMWSFNALTLYSELSKKKHKLSNMQKILVWTQYYGSRNGRSYSLNANASGVLIP